MLIIVSGPDRVGKSTLINKMVKELGGDCFVCHHGPPNPEQPGIFDHYFEDLKAWRTSAKTHCIFDRAYPCSYILEQYRCRNAGHFEEVIDFEITLASLVKEVVHVGVFKPWFWSASLHIEELRQEFPKASEWKIRDEYVARMQEHQLYMDQIENFYANVSMFPNVKLYDFDLNGGQVVAQCLETLRIHHAHTS